MALDDIKVIAKNIKAELSRKYPKYGFSVSSERGITDSLYVNWYSADFNPFTDPDTKEAFVNAWRSNEPDERFNEKGNNVVRYIIDTVNKYYKSSGDAYHTTQNFYRNIKVGTYAKPFTVVGSSSGSSGYRRSSGSTQPKGWDFGFLVYECSAGWNIYKKTLNDGRLVFNVRKLPETAPNKTDWAAIRGEMYTQVGFKWNPRGQAFERWGSISNEESTFSEICKTLSKYYKVSEQPETPQPAPEPQKAESEEERKPKEVNESYKSIPYNPYLQYVEIKWAEGFPEYAELFPRRFQSFKQVTKFIADNIGELEEAGYDKHSLEWVFNYEPEKVHSDRWDIGESDGNNPNVFPNLWAKEQLQGIFWHVLHYSEMTPDDEETQKIDTEYFNLTKQGMELTNDEFNKIVDYVTSMKYYKKDSFPKYIYPDERKERLMEMFPKIFSLFAEAEEAPAVKSRADIEKAIKGLRVLANAGNEKAAKAIKGLEILLRGMVQSASTNYSQLKLLYSFPAYKRKPSQNVLYSPDTTKPVEVGGRKEKGYELSFLEAIEGVWVRKPSGFVITERELNELISGKTIESSGATVSIFLGGEMKASGGYMAGGGGVEPIPDDFEYRGSGDEPYTAKFVNKNDGTVLSVSNFVVDPISNKMYRLSPQEALYRHFEKSFESGGYMAGGGEVGGLNVYEAVYLYVKKGLKQPFREKYLKPVGLYNTEKAKEVELNLKKKGYLNSAGAITESGKNKARELDNILEGSMHGYIGSGSWDIEDKFQKLKEKFESDGYMAGGGQVDLFEHYEQQPEELREILERYESEEADYEILQQLQQEVEAIGYTFEYGLDAEPFGLRPIGVPLNELEGYEDYESGGYMAKGGKSSTTLPSDIQVIPDDLYTENPSGAFLVVDTVRDKILGVFDTKREAGVFRNEYLKENKHKDKKESGGYMAGGGRLSVKKKYDSISEYLKNAKKGDLVLVNRSENDLDWIGDSHLDRFVEEKDGEATFKRFVRKGLITYPNNYPVIVIDKKYESGGYMAGGGKIPDWLFIGTYPNAYIYADNRIEEKGEYHEIGRITFTPFKLEYKDKSKKYAEVRDMMWDEYRKLDKELLDKELAGKKLYVTVSTTGQKAQIDKKDDGGYMALGGQLREIRQGKLLDNYVAGVNSNIIVEVYLYDGDVYFIETKRYKGRLVNPKIEKLTKKEAVEKKWLNEDGSIYSRGGRLKSAIMRDRKYKSDEPHEQAYSRKRRPKNRRYSK